MAWVGSQLRTTLASGRSLLSLCHRYCNASVTIPPQCHASSTLRPERQCSGLFSVLEVLGMFQIPIRRPLVRWADCPGKVIASRRYRATSGRLIAIARPSVPDAPLMALCCGSDRLIVVEGLCCTNSLTLPAKHYLLLACTSHTYILDLLKQERQLDRV